MKSLVWLALSCLIAVSSYAQHTATVPIVVASSSQSSLPVSDFTVEVNHQPVSVASVTPLSGRHLQYDLIYDARVHTNWGDEPQVAEKLLKLVITPGFDRGTLFSYGELILLGRNQNITDPRKLASEIVSDRISPARLYDAVGAAASWLAKQQSGSDERKVVFLVCDGKDTGSQSDLDAAVRDLQRASVPLFAFVPSYLQKRKEGQRMRELSEQSGGRVYFLPPNTKHLTFDDLKRDLTDSFLLTINLPEQKGWLPLKITNATHPESPILSQAYVFVP